MSRQPKTLYTLIFLWLILSLVFIIWGGYSLLLAIEIPNWRDTALKQIYPSLFFGYLLSTITWFVFSCLFFVFAYGTYKLKKWVWTS